MSANDYSLLLLEEAEETSRVQWLLAQIEAAEDAHGSDGCMYCRLGRALDVPSLALERGRFKKQMLGPQRSRVIDRRHL